eukprot:TRINITY_DN131_c0_g1_i1.p1 TRINITY_DN131_c0_g1~~TRINITY_DN131_c0_g1_i1.p1  ORF type:complete len:130 (+),score=15.77 TRINITY_DN131_c0_g1_i1:120-509(+)
MALVASALPLALYGSVGHIPGLHSAHQKVAKFRTLRVRKISASQNARGLAVRAQLNDGTGENSSVPDASKKKFITKEEEPAQYWQTAAEREGRGPMQTLLPYIAILGLLTPFLILGVAFALGWIQSPGR